MRLILLLVVLLVVLLGFAFLWACIMAGACDAYENYYRWKNEKERETERNGKI